MLPDSRPRFQEDRSARQIAPEGPVPECSVLLDGKEGASLESEEEALLAFEERASPELWEGSTSEFEEVSSPESEGDGGGAGVRVKAGGRTREEKRIAKV